MKTTIMLCSLLVLLSFCSCGSSSNKSTSDNSTASSPTVQVPVFDADSAYRYIQKQVDFGPRVPNTKAHKACANHLAAQLEKFGAKVIKQEADLVAYDGTLLKACNIIGSYQPDNKRRIALFAHWDSRPWADNDPDEKNHHTPILGANDGASGVGVLLEIARQIQQKQPELGIDIIFFDAEDYGEPQFSDGDHKEESWCLGSQYWAHMPHVANYNARFGILLDMVGGKDATFYKEGHSEKYAADVNKKVWKAAKRLGYERNFVNNDGGFTTDDHLFVNRIAQIKTIDIVPSDPSGKYSFNETWHTINDNMEHIDRSTLKAVGQTVLEVLYNEK